MGRKQIENLREEVEIYVGQFRKPKDVRVDLNTLLIGYNNGGLWPLLMEAFYQGGEYEDLEPWEYMAMWDRLSPKGRNYIKASLRIQQLETDNYERDKGGKFHRDLWGIKLLVPAELGGYLEME